MECPWCGNKLEIHKGLVVQKMVKREARQRGMVGSSIHTTPVEINIPNGATWETTYRWEEPEK